MAFASTTTTAPGPDVLGSSRLISGTYTNAETDSGGAISTGFSVIIACGVFSTNAIGNADPKFTVSGGTITVVTSNGADGSWWAIGR